MPLCSALIATLLSLLPNADAGDSLTAFEKIRRADLVLELRVPVEGEIPASWPNQGYDPAGWAFPDSLRPTDAGAVEVTRVLVGEAPEVLSEPARFYVFSGGSACWWLAHQRGGLRTLVFLERDGDSWRQVFGTEGEWGAYTDLSPGYDALAAALTRAGGWGDERAQAVDAAAMWQDQRAALAGDDPYLRVLARDFLLAHDAAAVLDEVWGPGGTPERAAAEAKTRWPHDPGLCVAELEAQ